MGATLIVSACGGGATPTSAETANTIPIAASTPSPIPLASQRSSAECTGPEVDWSDLPSVAGGYGAAWNERDADIRDELLEAVFAENGTYVDPNMDEPTNGRQSLSVLIGDSHAAFGTAYFVPRQWSVKDQHHGRLRMPWLLCSLSGEVIWIGVDVATLNDDGMIESVVGFFTEPPQAESSVCSGLGLDGLSLPPIARTYLSAWNERDDAARMTLLEDIWNDEGTYLDAHSDEIPVGREAFSEHINRLQPAALDEYFEPRGWDASDQHHGHVRMAWRVCDAAGNVGSEGEDIGELDDDGRFVTVATFLGS